VGDEATLAALRGVMTCAGVGGAKHTASLIPMCHTLHLTAVDVQVCIGGGGRSWAGEREAQPHAETSAHAHATQGVPAPVAQAAGVV
jgi:molybdenum cofactor biosynthesis enzyme